MRILALDVGTRHTGVAVFTDDVGFPLPLDTVHHASDDELEECIMKIIRERSIGQVVAGLPLLPSGKEGAQSGLVRSFVERLIKNGVSAVYLDERYSTPRPGAGKDGDATAACHLLTLYLERKEFDKK